MHRVFRSKIHHDTCATRLKWHDQLYFQNNPSYYKDRMDHLTYMSMPNKEAEELNPLKKHLVVLNSKLLLKQKNNRGQFGPALQEGVHPINLLLELSMSIPSQPADHLYIA